MLVKGPFLAGTHNLACSRTSFHLHCWFFGLLALDSLRSCRLHGYIDCTVYRKWNWCLVLFAFLGIPFSLLLNLSLSLWCSTWSHISVTFNWRVWEVSFYMRVFSSCLDFPLYGLRGQGGWATTKFRSALVDGCCYLNVGWFLILFCKMEIQYLLLLFYLKWASVMAKVNCSNIVCFDLIYVFLPLHYSFQLFPLHCFLCAENNAVLVCPSEEFPRDFGFQFLFPYLYGLHVWCSNNAFWYWRPHLDWLIQTKHVYSKYLTQFS